jgi:catalase
LLLAEQQAGMDPSKYRPRDQFDAGFTTTLGGAPVADTTRSSTVGDRGPILLEDFHLLEKLANFDRERIPERVVHARGVTAKGTFTCSRDLTNVTAANVFSRASLVTDVAVRFSTVVHSRHSPETLRDPRGFAVKFYTREGNWDLVGYDDTLSFPKQRQSLKSLQRFLVPSHVTFFTTRRLEYVI